MKRLLLFIFLMPAFAHAFPELTRFGYNTCTACHVSPTGGGLLTAYGRKVSSELINTWGTEAQTGVFWGAVNEEKFEEFLLLGGDYRAVQVHSENARVKMGRFFTMQADLAAALTEGAWTVFMSVGKQESDNWKPDSTQYWAKWTPTDNAILRGGRFTPGYGLQLSDHIAFIKGALGFGLESARDGIELTWASENWSASFTHSRETRATSPERANSIKFERALQETSRIGFNYWRGDSDRAQRDLAGAWAIAGFSKRFYWLTELDWQSERGSATRNSFTTYQKIGYTAFKGFDLNLLYERHQSDLSKDDTLIERRGPGFQFTPLAHFEFSGNWTKQKAHTPNSTEEDYAWLILHYYL